MKKNRLVAALLSLVMMVGALPGLVWADIVEYDIQVHDGIILNEDDYPGPYTNPSTVGIVVDNPSCLSDGVIRYSYYTADGVDTRDVEIYAGVMGRFQIMDGTYAGPDASKHVIDVSAYYPVTVANSEHCAAVVIKYLDMITRQTLIESPSCPSGATTRVYVTASDGYYADAVEYQYTTYEGTNTGSATLKTDDSGSYFEFVMPNSPVSISVHTTKNGHRYTSYVNADGDTVYTDAIVLTADSENSLTNDWYVVTGTFTHAGRFNIADNDVNIILEDGASLDAAAGIAVNEGNTLTIWGQSNNSGTLTATASSSGDAGIGSNSYSSCGTINIYGGTIVAKGATDGPGIGLGHQGLGRSSGMNATINIHGGIITATGGWRGAGIGSGYSDEIADGTLRINIDGGSINAIRGGWDRESYSSRSVASIGRGFTAYAIPCYIVFDCEAHPYDIRIQGETYMTSDTNYHLTLVGDFVGSSGSTYAAGTYTNAEFLDGETLVSAVSQPHFTGHSLTLAGDIGVNYFVDLSMLTEEERQGATVDFTINGRTVPDTYDPDFRNENGDYGFTVNITSIEMADTISAVLHVGDKAYTAKDYSAQAYYDQIIADPATYGQYAFNLVKALKNYGHYVQLFLSNARDWTIGDDGDHRAINEATTIDMDDAAELSGYLYNTGYYAPVVSSHEGVGLTFSLNLESTTTIRLYLDPGEAVFEDPIVVTVDGRPVEYEVLSNGVYRVDIAGIPAGHLGYGYSVNFSYGDDQSITISNLSAISYVRTVLLQPAPSDAAGRNSWYAMCALYNYHIAANSAG